MKAKSLAVLGILLASLAGSGVVSHAAGDVLRVYEADTSYDVSTWIKPDGTVETDFTYEDAPWIADDGTVDNDFAHYLRIANAEAGGTEVNSFYDIAKNDVHVYKEKDRDSEAVAEFDLNDLIYVHLLYEDGWAWSGECQGYIRQEDLSGGASGGKVLKEKVFAKTSEASESIPGGAVTIVIDGYEITISPRKD